MEWSSILNRKAICSQWRLYDGTGDQRLSDDPGLRMTGNCAPGRSTAEQVRHGHFEAFINSSCLKPKPSHDECEKDSPDTTGAKRRGE